MTATATLTGSQKAALLLLQLGRDRAARVLKQLDEYEIEELTAEIVRLEHVDQSLADEVVDEFWSAVTLGVGVGGGSILAERLLVASLGAERAAERKTAIVVPCRANSLTSSPGGIGVLPPPSRVSTTDCATCGIVNSRPTRAATAEKEDTPGTISTSRLNSAHRSTCS